uniref:Protein kinase domain-containing protein n=1 Tax=Panagrolaimus sp. ES5 TaxID=591445 RepID=A0AC34G6X0_9BILA
MNNFQDDVQTGQYESGSTALPLQHQQRYDLRPRSATTKRSDVIQIPIDATLYRNAKPPTPTAVLRQYGLLTSSSYALGSGHYSKVYKANQGDREFAVKVVRLDDFAVKVVRLDDVGDDFKKRFLPREKEIWSKLRHRNICELFACLGCEQFNYFYMVMEYCPNGDLLSYIQRNGALSDNLGRRWMRALLDAVVYLHKNNIAHRDIKAENILISRRYNVKLADYGFVCECPDNLFSRTYCGSRAYSSPEVLNGIPYDVKKNDVWSMGVLCFVSMTNTMPYREEANNNAAIVEQQRRKQYRWPSYVSHDCRKSIDSMMTFYQDERPTAKEAKKLPFFERQLQQHSPQEEMNSVYA